jgi:hypothetical protein
MTLITITQDGPIGVIALDNAKKHNALSHQLVTEVIAALKTLGDAATRVVILRAQPGSKVWSAGHDIGELPEDGRDPLGWNDPRVIVKRIESETTTASGIVIPDNAAEKPDQGEVLAVGPGKKNDKGDRDRHEREGRRPRSVRQVLGPDRQGRRRRTLGHERRRPVRRCREVIATARPTCVVGRCSESSRTGKYVPVPALRPPSL